MKILLTGSFGNEDIGDDAMLTMHLDNLYNRGVEKKDIHLLGFKPDYMAWYWDHPRENCHSGFKHLDLKQMDCAIVTGGGTINTRPLSDSIHRMYYLVKEMSIMPIFMSGQTIGPLGINKEHDKMAKKIIETVDVLTVRDKGVSMKNICKIGADPKKFYETNDDATHLEPSDYSCEYENTVAVNATDYILNTDKRLKGMIKVCQDIIGRGYNVLLVSHHEMDFTLMQPILDKLPVKLISSKNLRGCDVKRIVSKCVAGIGARYHFIVFCLSQGIPCIGMAGNEYSFNKQYGFAEQIGVGEYITEDCTTDNILKLFDSAIKTKIPVCEPTKTWWFLNEWLNERNNTL